MTLPFQQRFSTADFLGAANINSGNNSLAVCYRAFGDLGRHAMELRNLIGHIPSILIVKLRNWNVSDLQPVYACRFTYFIRGFSRLRVTDGE